MVMNSKKQTERQTTYKQFHKSKNDFMPKFLLPDTNTVTLNGTSAYSLHATEQSDSKCEQNC